jgi:hypothetical protein
LWSAEYVAKSDARASEVSRYGVEMVVGEEQEVPPEEQFVDVRSLWLPPMKLGYEYLSTENRFHVVLNSIEKGVGGGEGGIDGAALYKKLKKESKDEDADWRQGTCTVSAADMCGGHDANDYNGRFALKSTGNCQSYWHAIARVVDIARFVIDG